MPYLRISFSYLLIALFTPTLTSYSQKIDIKKNITAMSDSGNRWNKLIKSVRGKHNTLIDSNTVNINKYIQSIQSFSGKHIASISIEQRHFSSAANKNNKLLESIETLADQLHNKTNQSTIAKNLFFKIGDTLSPLVVAYNEMWLRNLNFIQDARIFAYPSPFDKNSVYVHIVTRDIFPIGLAINLKGSNVIDNKIELENINDGGNAISLNQNYDLTRKEHWGWGAAYTHRNFKGSFWDIKSSYIQNGVNYIDNKMSATTASIGAYKPLLHPLDNYTAGLEWSVNKNNNLYFNDSVFKADYQYYLMHTDAWIGFQLSKKKLWNDVNAKRHVLQFRYLHNNFTRRPDLFLHYLNKNFYPTETYFGSYTVFQQKIIRTQYLYGLGRNEDLPIGQSFTVTSGAYHREQANLMPYLGLQWEKYTLLTSEHFNHYNISIGSSYQEQTIQDFRFLASIERISKIHYLSSGYRQRNVFNFSFATTLKNKFNEPLLINSIYGIPQLNQERINGGTRLNGNYESIWYNSKSYLGFKSAPFVFANLTYIRTIGQAIGEGDIYTALGGGMRVRNENLIFGTIELKGYYFPRTNLQMSPFNISLNTNIRFKYNSNIINKPDFVAIN